ncbi:MAG: GNAT family N-acetyltransferase [Lachnospiraceae bacterium]|nr:GNAT family N-acetyltransferase [Lachnospiraceae bacterium]
MKKFNVAIKEENVLSSLRPVCSRLQEMGVETYACSYEEAAKYSVSGERDQSLYLTDNLQLASMLGAGGYPVVAYVHPGNRSESFDHVKYVIEGFEDVGEGYFIRIWQRLTGRPWHILDTARCSIRETTPGDVDEFYEIYAHPSVTEYMEELCRTREEQRAYIETYAEKVYGFYDFGMWTVLLRETGQVIGRAGISMGERFEEPELGFVIGQPWQRQGLATEVCRGILEYARELGFQRINALVHPDNQKSRGLLEKLGFVCEKKRVIEKDWLHYVWDYENEGVLKV